jgi:hypothetical protein
MIMAEEERFLKAQALFDRILEFLREAGEDDVRIDQVERQTLDRLLKVGYELLEGYIGRCGDGDLGAILQKEETTLSRLPEKRRRRYVSIFGEHTFEQYVYAHREGQKIEHVEVDQRLGLPEGEFSYVIQDWLQRFCIKESFEEAARGLETLLGLRVCVRSAEHMNQHLGEHTEAFRISQPAPEADKQGDILVYANDCKGVPMRRPVEQRIRRGPRRGKGEKANKKQMACVGSAYSVAPFVRTADDILDEVFRQERAEDRPQPQNKRLWAEMTWSYYGDNPVNYRTRVFIQQALDLAARDPDRRKTVVCLMDGEPSLREAQHEWLPRAIGVLDIWHVIERLWGVAYCFHAEQSPAAARFVEDRLRLVLEGKVGYVIGHLRRRLNGARLTAEKRRTLRSAITYFENNREYMRYDQYLAAGYPIGSGVAEGACRHVVKDRMELTGMRWSVPGAQSMLNLRAIYINDDWPAFLHFYIQKEQTALYGLAAA